MVVYALATESAVRGLVVPRGHSILVKEHIIGNYLFIITQRRSANATTSPQKKKYHWELMNNIYISIGNYFSL
jgi:hypothetical protein